MANTKYHAFLILFYEADKRAQREDGRQEDGEKKAPQPREQADGGQDRRVEEIEREMTFLYIQKRSGSTDKQNPRRKRIGNGRSDDDTGNPERSDSDTGNPEQSDGDTGNPERSDGDMGNPDTRQRTEAPGERKTRHPSEHTRLEEKWIKRTDAGSEEMEEIRARMRARMEAARRGDRKTPTPEQERNLPEYSSWSYKQVRRRIKKKSVGPHTFHDSEREKGRRPEQ